MLAWRDHPQVTGLAEMMDYPGVISGQNALLDKLDAFRHLTLDGHCPGLGGKELNAYITAGIENCHESYQLEEGRRKLQLGMSLMIREGSAARNLNALAPLINEFNSPQCMLCTDDRNPWEIAHEGHIDALIRRLIEQHNVPLHVAYRVASWSTARHFGLNHLGLLAPGKQADIVLLSDARKVTVQQVLVKGEPIDAQTLQAEESARLAQSAPPYGNTIARQPVSASDFALQFTPGKRYRVIDVIHNELITHSHSSVYSEKGFDRDDVCFIAVLERYGQRLAPACGLLGGFGLNEGALAATVSHDSHNIVVIGRSAEEMALAVNQVYGNTIARQPVSASDFALQFTPGKRYRVIDVIHNELITHSHSSVYSEKGFDRDDVCFIAVLERYGQRLAPACGLLGGFGLNEGALAATVSHDSHNIVVIGRSAEEMALAVNQVIQDGGGLCVVRNGQVQSHLPLPIAGLMSTDTAQSLAEQIDALKAAARECGPLPDEPFIQMAFLSLPVIPALKLTSQGLFDGEKFAFTTLEVTE